VASKAVAEAFDVSAASKAVICTIFGQFCSVFVSAANAGLKVPVFLTFAWNAGASSESAVR
jgi:hypothetical protein